MPNFPPRLPPTQPLPLPPLRLDHCDGGLRPRSHLPLLSSSSSSLLQSIPPSLRPPLPADDGALTFGDAGFGEAF
jgi:hypothetical protein